MGFGLPAILRDMDNKVHPEPGWTFFWAATDNRTAGRDGILPRSSAKALKAWKATPEYRSLASECHGESERVNEKRQPRCEAW
jgi:hypothetical protein